MILVLEIVGEHAGTFGSDSRKLFNGCGGFIGRDPKNDWVLPDRYISARHATIHYEGDHFTIDDTSSNGIFVNSETEPIGKGHPRALRTGDMLAMDRFEVRVTLLDADGIGLPIRPVA
ncbi:MAG: FHA domain-containing protein [Steroidobacteraceae bacterium]